MLMNIMNFTITLEKSPDIAFGTLDENGNWNGIIGITTQQSWSACKEP